jgi:hypothetical protein
LVVTGFTAHGWHVWESLWRFFANREALDYIVEWSPPKVLEVSGLPFFLGVGGLIYQASRGKVSTRDIWMIGPFLLYGFTSFRALLPAMIVLLPWMVPELSFMQRPLVPANRSLVLATALVILLLPMAMISAWGEVDEEIFPVAATEYLDADIPAFHDDATGGYLIFARGPDMRIYVDDRAELYGGNFIGRLGLVLAGSPIWNEDQEKWGIGQALLEAEDGLVQALALSGWSEVFRDGNFVLLRNYEEAP